jgi:hypothetical protein
VAWLNVKVHANLSAGTSVDHRVEGNYGRTCKKMRLIGLLSLSLFDFSFLGELADLSFQ